MRKILYIILFITLSIVFITYAGQDIITDFDERSIAILNEEIRKLNKLYTAQTAPGSATYITQTANSDLSAEQALSSLSTGIMYVTNTTGVITSLGNPLPIANGGTNSTTAQTAIDALLPSQTGNSGKYLTTNATNSSWGTISSAGTSNVIFEWYGVDSLGTNNIVGLYESTSLSPDINVATFANYRFFGVYENTLRTLSLKGKFTKIAGISTVTIFARTWCSGVTGTQVLKVDIGGQNNTVSCAVTSPAWATSATIDVSSLTNGTDYDITFQLGGGNSTYCSAVVLIAS
jgi:hypothetical protein